MRPLLADHEAALLSELTIWLYTLTASAHRHNLDMWAYLDDVLRRLAGGESDLDALLPDTWAKARRLIQAKSAVTAKRNPWPAPPKPKPAELAAGN